MSGKEMRRSSVQRVPSPPPGWADDDQQDESFAGEPINYAVIAARIRAAEENRQMVKEAKRKNKAAYRRYKRDKKLQRKRGDVDAASHLLNTSWTPTMSTLDLTSLHPPPSGAPRTPLSAGRSAEGLLEGLDVPPYVEVPSSAQPDRGRKKKRHERRKSMGSLAPSTSIDSDSHSACEREEVQAGSDVGRQYGTVKDKKRKGPLERLIKKALFMPPRKTTYKFDQRYYRHITTRHGFEMPIYFCCAPSNSEWWPRRDYTIIYSHGNSEDLGMGFWWMHMITLALGMNTLGYEYRGYFKNSGPPSETKCYEDLEDVVQYLIRATDCTISNIILYGRSLGTGPSVHFASRNHIAGLVLECPYLSIGKVISQGTPRRWDVFPNYSRIGKCDCPVFIAHGDRDRVVPFSHGMKLKEICEEHGRFVQFVKFEGRGHNNLRTEYDVFIQLLFNFFSEFLPLRGGAVPSSSTTDVEAEVQADASPQPTRKLKGSQGIAHRIHTEEAVIYVQAGEEEEEAEETIPVDHLSSPDVPLAAILKGQLSGAAEEDVSSEEEDEDEEGIVMDLLERE